MNFNLSGWTLVKTCQIDGTFSGFNNEQVFPMTDGSFWYQSAYKYRYYYAYRPKAAVYSKGRTFILIIDGLSDYVEVTPTSGISATIVSDFHGWSGDTLFELDNGQVWKQDAYAYTYKYAYRPAAIIVNINGHFVLNVEGESVSVKRIA